MYEHDWQLFLKRGESRAIAVAQVSAEIREHLSATDNKVRIHHACAMKALLKHDLRASDFEYLFDVVEFGSAIADKERHVTFLHRTERGWFQLTIKRAMDTGRIYICTYYKTKPAEVRRKLAKHPVLRKDKWAT